MMGLLQSGTGTGNGMWRPIESSGSDEEDDGRAALRAAGCAAGARDARTLAAPTTPVAGPAARPPADRRAPARRGEVRRAELERGEPTPCCTAVGITRAITRGVAALPVDVAALTARAPPACEEGEDPPPGEREAETLGESVVTVGAVGVPAAGEETSTVGADGTSALGSEGSLTSEVGGASSFGRPATATLRCGEASATMSDPIRAVAVGEVSTESRDGDPTLTARAGSGRARTLRAPAFGGTPAGRASARATGMASANRDSQVSGESLMSTPDPASRRGVVLP
jgi:hypothetical protein